MTRRNRRTRRTGWARGSLLGIAALLLAASALVATPAAASARPADTAPDTFSIRNLTQLPLVTTKVAVGANQGWSHTFGSRFPYPGQVIQPGKIMYWDLAFNYNGPGGAVLPTTAAIDYTVGAGGPAIHITAYQNDRGAPGHQTSYGCVSDDPAWSCTHDGHGADVFSTAKHDTVVPASDPTLQAQLLNALCQSGNPAVHCDFTPTSGKDPQKVTMSMGHIGDDQYNYTEEISKHSWAQEWETGVSMKVGASWSPIDIDAEGAIKVEVKVTYEHEWGTSHADEIVNGVKVDPGFVGYIEASIPALQVTGNFRVGVGNDWWTLQGMTFTTPEQKPDADGVFDWSAKGREREMTAAEKADPPPTP